MDLAPAFPWRTERVELFLLEPGHVTDEYVGWLRDREVNRYLECRFAPHDLASTMAFVAKMRADADVLMLGIRSSNWDRARRKHQARPDRPQSRTRRDRPDDRRPRRLGARDRFRRDQLSSARSPSGNSGLRKLTAGCYASNVGSARAFEKAGFHVEATRKDHFLLDGRSEDLLLMANSLRR